jgi:uncharacterized protein with HEPN domain
MLDAAKIIHSYGKRGRQMFDADQTLRDAILYQIVVIGEAAKSALDADPSIEDEFPGIEWSAMARMRDRVAHHYWATDHDVVWTTAVESVPKLQKELNNALKKLQK